MKVTYDSEVDALYIRFIRATVTTVQGIEGGRFCSLDSRVGKPFCGRPSL